MDSVLTHEAIQQEVATERSRKVCMHVLGPVRNDMRVIRSATALLEAGYAVSIVDLEENRNQPGVEELYGITVKHVLVSDSFMRSRFSKWAFLRLARILARVTWQVLQTPADIYHAHDESALPACYVAARLRRKKLLFDAHELPLDEMREGMLSRMKPVLNRLLAMFVSRCAGVITVSPPIAREIRQRYRASNVALVRNIPPFQKVPASDLLRQSLGLNSDAHIALYQGNLTPDRGLERLIRAATFLDQNIVIVIMGRGELEAELKALIMHEGVADRVKVLPPVPYQELLNWTASADAGLMVYAPDRSLNVRMCLPNKLFEYLMAGLPVLSSQLDAVVDILETYDVGQVVSSLTPENVALAINALVTNHAVYARLRRNALQASQQELHWDREKQKLIQMYAELLPLRHMAEMKRPRRKRS